MKKLSATARSVAWMWSVLVLLGAAFMYVEFAHNGQYQGRNGQYVYGHAEDLSPQARAAIEDRCRRIYDKTSVRIIVLITRNPDQTLDATANLGMTLLHQSAPNQFLNQLSLNTPMIVAAFWERPGESVQQLYIPTVNAERLGITLDGLLKDKPPVTFSLEQAVESTVDDVGSDVTRGLLTRTWRGRVTNRSVIVAAYLVCMFFMTLWVPALVFRTLDGRAAAGWVLAESLVGIAALFGLFRSCIYFGGWPEGAGGLESLARFAAAGLAVPLFAAVAQRMNRAHLGRVTRVLTIASLVVVAAAMLHTWEPQSVSIVEHSTNIWRMSPQLSELPLFQVVVFIGLMVFVLWSLCLLALPIRFVLDALGDDSPFVLGAISERVVLLDRALCLQTGKPVPLPMEPGPGLGRLAAETSFGYVFWAGWWFACFFAGPLTYKQLAKRPRLWPYGLRYDYAVRRCLPDAEELYRQGETLAALRSASEAMEIMKSLQGQCPLIPTTRASIQNHLLLGNLILQRGEPEEARRHLLKARTDVQGVSELLEVSILERIGRFYRELGDLPRAARVYEEENVLLTSLANDFAPGGQPLEFRQMAKLMRQKGPTARLADVPGLLVPALDLHSALEYLELEVAKVSYLAGECLESMASEEEAVGTRLADQEKAAECGFAAFAEPLNASSIGGKLKELLRSKRESAELIGHEAKHVCLNYGQRGDGPHDTPFENDALLQTGMDMLEHGDFPGAFKSFQDAADQIPHDPRPHGAMGYAHELNGNSLRALEHYRKAADLDASFFWARRGFARACLRLGHHDVALHELEQLLERVYIDREDIALAMEYFREVKIAESEKQACEKMLAHYPEDAPAASRLSDLMIECDDPEGAARALWTGLRHDPLADVLWLKLDALSVPLTRDRYETLDKRESEWTTSSGAELSAAELDRILAFNSPFLAKRASINDRALLPVAHIALLEGIRVLEAQPAASKAVLLFALHANLCLSKKDAVAETYFALSQLGLSLSCSTAAVQLARFGLEIAEEIGDSGLGAQGHAALARAYRRQGDLVRATEHYARAIEYREGVRERITALDARSLYLRRGENLYAEQVFSLLDLGQIGMALEFVERSKSRDLIDLLGNHKLHIRSGAGADILERDEQLQRDLVHFERLAGELRWEIEGLELEDLNGALNRDGQERLVKDQRDYQFLTENLNRTRQELAAVKQDMRDSTGEWATLRVVKTLPFADVPSGEGAYRRLTEALAGSKDRTVAVEYFVTDEGTAIFLIPCWDGPLHPVQAVRSSLNRVALDRIVHEDFPRTIREAGEKPEFLERLYADLVAPIEEELKELNAEALLFSPHGHLHALPLHAMCRADSQGRLRFVIEDYACGYVPSLSILDLLQGKREGRGEGAFVIGNPTGDLDFAEKEAHDVAGLLNAKSHVQGEATEERLRVEAPDKAVIHLACHGHFEPLDALQSHLTLADGFLQVDEVLDLEIRAGLVTLSACSSGVSRISRGDELVGMTRAWLYAGSPSVVASLWDVAEGSTATLMAAFYESWHGTGHSKIRALQMAQLQWLHQRRAARKKRYPSDADAEHGWQKEWHPYYWSPFTLTGDPL